MRYLNSPDHNVRAGALLALGMSSRGAAKEPFDPILRILAGQFNPHYDFLERKPGKGRFPDIIGIRETARWAAKTVHPPPTSAQAAPGVSGSTTGPSPVFNPYTQQYGACSLNGRRFQRIGRNNETADFHNSKEALSALSLGLAYAGTNN